MTNLTNNPFTPWTSHKTLIPELFINRESELDEAINYLCIENSNVRISGESGIGKTSFLNQLYYIISNEHKNCLTLKLDLFSVLARETIDLSQYFVLAIISKIWETIFKKDYADLMEEIKQPDEKILKSNEKGRIITLFKLLRSSKFNSSFEKGADIGAKLVFEGSVSTRSSSNFEFNGILPFELDNILIELVTILKNHNKEKIILLIDEANYLNIDSADKIIRKNFNLFLNEFLCYAFVTFSPSLKMSYEAEKIFHRDIIINPFDSLEIVSTLIIIYCDCGNKKNGSNIRFSKESIELIHIFSKGHPRTIQWICHNAWEKAIDLSLDTVEVNLIEETIIIYDK